jgi:hypothetical protein
MKKKPDEKEGYSVPLSRGSLRWCREKPGRVLVNALGVVSCEAIGSLMMPDAPEVRPYRNSEYGLAVGQIPNYPAFVVRLFSGPPAFHPGVSVSI